MLDPLTCDAFAPYVGQAFTTTDDDGARVQLTLTASESGPTEGAGGARRPFKLVFHGPLEPVLWQRIRALEHAAFPGLEIFIVPNGPDGGRMRYEAVFT